MKKYTKYKLMAILGTSFFIVSFELVRHYVLIDHLPKDIDILFSSILFILISVLVFHYIFYALEKLEIQTYQKEIEAKALFDNSVDGIFVFDSKGEVLDMNEGAETLSGWKRTQPLTFEMLFATTLSMFEKSSVEKGRESPRVFESHVVKKSGGKVPVSLTLSYVNNLPDNSAKIAVIARDLSERKRMENVIRKLYAEASQKHYETESLYQISRKMATIRDLSTQEAQDILAVVSRKIRKLLNVSDVSIFLRSGSQETYSLIASTKEEDIPDIEFFEKQHWEEFEFVGDQMVIPFQSNDKIGGFIIGEGVQTIESSMQQQEVVRSLKQIFSITIENGYLYQKLRGVTIIEERERLAREMHDGLAQSISSMSVKLQILKSLILPGSKERGDSDSEKLHELLKELEDITNESYHEIRHHLFNLRTPFQMQKPFPSSLADYADVFERQTGIEVDLVFDHSFSESEGLLTPEIKVHVIRIIQEALSNVKKHANATKVSLRVYRLKNEGWEIVIEDNGHGFYYEKNSENPGKYGLEIMKERAGLFGGEMHIETMRGAGTRVIVSFSRKGDHDDEHKNSSV